MTAAMTIKALTPNPIYLDFDVSLSTAHSLASYTQRAGYEAWKAVKSKYKPEEYVQMIKASNLWGRGGAGFSAGMKWSFLPKNNDKPVYLCINADEGEPGTFKDRFIMEQNPHQLLEGILLTCYAIRCQSAFLYIRGEMFLAKERMAGAIEEARQAGLLQGVQITVVSGGGAYICGEETSLINSIEGKKGFPRNKPPFPANVGLYGCPTIVNNVQTLATLPWITRSGAEAYSKIGTGKSTGTHLFGVSGHVNRPGLYEAPLGYPFKKLIYEDCGGILGNRKLKAVIPGGSSVYVLRGEEADKMNLDIDSIRSAGSLIGTGAIIVIAEGTCMVRSLLVLLRFYAHESCGQCTPCREGLGWLRDIVARIEKGQGKPGDPEELIRLADGIEGYTVCPLADAACWPTRSYVDKFRAEFMEHIQTGKCPFEQKFPSLL